MDAQKNILLHAYYRPCFKRRSSLLKKSQDAFMKNPDEFADAFARAWF